MYYAIAPEKANATGSRQFCRRIGGSLSLYNAALAKFIFEFSENNRCPIKYDMFMNSSIEDKKCLYYVAMIKSQIIKKFICSDKTHLHFVCQILEENTLTTKHKYQTSVMKTVNKMEKNSSNRTKKTEEKNDNIFYLVLALAIFFFIVLSSIATFSCLVSNGLFGLF